jgi:hypothetical protein
MRIESWTLCDLKKNILVFFASRVPEKLDKNYPAKGLLCINAEHRRTIDFSAK